MIPIELRKSLKAEMDTLFESFWLKNANGDMCRLNIYEQRLPAKKHQDDEDHFPYLVIRIQDGEETGEIDPHTCRVLFIVGIIDESGNNRGEDDVLNILAKIQQHLFIKRVFAGKYRVEYPFSWSLPEEDVYPYYFGGLETNWIVGKITQREEDYT